MNNKQISIIVPIYNIEAYIKQCIDSIIRQSYRNIEIILVDDGSKDRSGAICDEYAQIDSRIKVIHKQNGGVSSARNVGLDHAKGDYIMSVDPDDWVEPSFCEDAIEMINKYDVDIVVFGYKSRYLNKAVEHKTTHPRLLERDEAIRHLVLLDEPSMISHQWNKIIKKNLFEHLRYPEGMIYEGTSISYRLFYQVSHIYLSDKLLYNYRMRMSSQVGTANRKRIKNSIDRFVALSDRLDFIKAYYPDPELIESQTTRIAKTCMVTMKCLKQDNPETKRIYELMSAFLTHNKQYLLQNTKDKYLKIFLQSEWMYAICISLSRLLGKLKAFVKSFSKNKVAYYS